MHIYRILRSLSWMLLLCLSGLVPGQVSASTGTYVPNIVDPSLPQFSNNVTVRANRGNWTISGNRGFIFDVSPTESWNGTGSYRLRASFDNSGAFIGGTISLIGKIPGLVDSRQLLMSADLVLFDYAAAGDVIGFNTDNIYCNPLLGVTCTPSESVLVWLDDIFNGNVNGRFRTSGLAVTSVPLPGALLLFVSGLGWLAARPRRTPDAI